MILFLIPLFFFSIFELARSACNTVERCPCIATTSTLLCTATSCQSVFYPTNLIYSYDHLVFTNDQGCKPCPYYCQICNTEANCVQCENQYYLSNGTCISCSIINCYTCDNQTCLSCRTGYYLDQTTGICSICPINGTLNCPSVSTISSCAVSFYLSNDGANCIQCDRNCLICLSATNCGTCNQGYYILNYQCLTCNTSCLSCQNSSACTACPQGMYLNTSNLCQFCNNTFYNCFNCTFNNCTVCRSGYYLTSTKTCSSVNTSISNCYVYSNINTCSICNIGYFLINNTCYYGCSNLCTNCSGPHFGLCYSCAPNTYLFNMNCIPSYNINSGLEYQTLITARNNLNNFIPSTTVYCLETSVGYSSTLIYPLSNLAGYNIMVKWKIYLYNINLQQQQISYNVALVNKLSSSQQLIFMNITPSLDICNTLTGMEYIEKNKTNFTTVAAQNNLTFTTISSLLLSVSEIYIIVDRCGGLYGTNCLECSSFNNCTVCKNSSYFILGADCVTTCPTNYYTYLYKMTCYQSCPIGSYNINSNLTCVVCAQYCTSCTNSSYCNTCENGYFLLQNAGSCVSACPSRYYGNSITNTCNNCIYPCLTCISDLSCTSCYYGFLYNLTYSCLSACPDTYYGDLNIDSCVSCNSTLYHCLTCLNSFNNCLSCDSVNPYLLNYVCYKTCPVGYYNFNTSCLICDPICFSCSISPTNCTLCNYGYLYNYTCSTCPNGYYGQIFTSTCKACDPTCLTCQFNSTFCLACSINYYFMKQTSICLSGCPQYYYSANFNCYRCVLPCKTCSSISSCLSCDSLYYYNNSCVESSFCPNSTYSDPMSFQCKSCNPNNTANGCLTCQDAVTCTSCGVNYFLFNNTCISVCPSRYYASSNRLCNECINPCLTCTNSTYCLSCRSGYFFVPFNSYCVVKCSIGFYTSSNSSCLLCNSTCASCTNLTACITCSFSYYLNPVDSSGNIYCASQCPSGYFGYNLYCYPCLPPCLTCIDEIRCLSCIAIYGIQYEYECISNCIAGTFNSGNITCALCISPCMTCINNANWCTSCQILNGSLLFLENNTCVLNCTVGYFQNLIFQVCSICSTTCLTCQYNETYCTSCLTGFLYENECIVLCPTGFYSIQHDCFKCESPCFTCSNKTTCLTCISNYFLQLNNATCVMQCNQTSYPQNSIQVCQACVYPCRRCIDSINCLSCLYGSYYKNQCLEMCPINTFSIGNITQYNLLICSACSPACLTCINITFCLSCQNSSLYLINGACLLNCPQKYYGDNTGQCLPCQKSCSNCSNGYTCNSCTIGFLFNSQCIMFCPNGYVIFQSICLACTNNCLTCIVNSSNCLSCKTNSFLYLQTCVQNCPYGTFSYYQNQSCISCKPPCQSCKQEYSCDSCMYGYILYRGVSNNQCVLGPYCPNSYFLNLDSEQCISLSQCPLNSMIEYSNKTCSEKCPIDLVAFNPNYTCLEQCPAGFWVDSHLICQRINSETPTLPQFTCYFHISRNLFVIECFLNKNSPNLPTITSNNISLSEKGNIDILALSQNYINILLFPSRDIILNTQIDLTFFTRHGIRDSNNIPLKNNPVYINIPEFYGYSLQNRESGIFMYQISSSISEGALIFWIAGLIRNKGIESVRLLDLFQHLYLLCYLDINYAPNIGQFLEGFKFAAFQFLPKIHLNIDKTNSLQKFYVLTNGVNFFGNFLPAFIIIMIFLFIFLLLFTVNKIIKIHFCSEQDDIYRKVSGKLQILIKRFRFDHVNDCMYVTALPIFLFTFAQFTKVTVLVSYFSVLVAAILTSIIGYFVGYVANSLSSLTSNNKKSDPFGFCTGGINIQSTYGHYHICVLYIEKFIKTGILIYSYSHPTFVLSCFSIISICNIVIYAKQPYSIKMTNYFNFTQEILLVLLNLTLVAVALNDSFNVNQRIVIGWISCIIILLIILLGLIYSSAHLLIYEWFEWQQKKAQQQKKQLQMQQHEEIGDMNQDETQTNKINAFFSKANVEEQSNSSFHTEVNVIKQNYLFESDCEKSDQEQIPRILIKCVKTGYKIQQQQQQPPQDNNNHPDESSGKF